MPIEHAHSVDRGIFRRAAETVDLQKYSKEHPETAEQAAHRQQMNDPARAQSAAAGRCYPPGASGCGLRGCPKFRDLKGNLFAEAQGIAVGGRENAMER